MGKLRQQEHQCLSQNDLSALRTAKLSNAELSTPAVEDLFCPRSSIDLRAHCLEQTTGKSTERKENNPWFVGEIK